MFVNAKWLFRLTGVYTTPVWGINLAGFYNARSGYPYIATIQTPTRPFSGGQTDVYLDLLGDNRLPNFQTVDFKIDKTVTFAHRVKVSPSLDIFNMLNGSTTLSVRGRQNSTTANTVSSLVGPRVLRFGVRVNW